MHFCWLSYARTHAFTGLLLTKLCKDICIYRLFVVYAFLLWTKLRKNTAEYASNASDLCCWHFLLDVTTVTIVTSWEIDLTQMPWYPPSGHLVQKWRRINVDTTWSRRIDVDTTSFWYQMPAGRLVIQSEESSECSQQPFEEVASLWTWQAQDVMTSCWYRCDVLVSH